MGKQSGMNPGVDDEFPMEGKPKDPEKAGLEEHSEDSENEDDQETSDLDDQETSDSDDQETHDSDAEQDLGTSSQSAVEQSMCLSSFDIHLGHKLTKAEVENLSKKKWIYEWEVPAVGMTKGKWAGTRECFTKLNHVFKTRDLVTKNDAKVSKLRETACNEILIDDSFLDHGFTRPKGVV
ncbi:hypothetical protein C1H46_029560 [Malus baccata]|uniref:UTP25 NTP hydrolase-like domain-containing protein n=1 Tax=Malus baccata TaxID=106549 RepID=A0A540LEI6_MALBA|nr:hypothetical protein C1H46_029560 [Malus baccata]